MAGSGAREGWLPRWYWPSFSLPGSIWLLLFFVLPFYVLLAVPITAVLVTLVDVIVRDVEPSEQEVPALLFTREEGR